MSWSEVSLCWFGVRISHEPFGRHRIRGGVQYGIGCLFEDNLEAREERPHVLAVRGRARDARGYTSSSEDSPEGVMEEVIGA